MADKEIVQIEIDMIKKDVTFYHDIVRLAGKKNSVP